jgi:hypothetical protein
MDAKALLLTHSVSKLMLEQICFCIYAFRAKAFSAHAFRFKTDIWASLHCDESI